MSSQRKMAGSFFIWVPFHMISERQKLIESRKGVFEPNHDWLFINMGFNCCLFSLLTCNCALKRSLSLPDSLLSFLPAVVEQMCMWRFSPFGRTILHFRRSTKATTFLFPLPSITYPQNWVDLFIQCERKCFVPHFFTSVV